VFDSLAEAYYQHGDEAKALENYSQALKMNPNLASAKRMLAG
jgi:Tfp pilus assembly protein PilF